MVRIISALSILAFVGLVGCSDDTKVKSDTTKKKEAGTEASTVDGVVADISKTEATTKETSTVDHKITTEGKATFEGVIALYEATGIVNGTSATILAPFVEFFPLSGGYVSPKPDFQDSGSAPQCLAWKWSSTAAPNLTTGDAGNVTISGYTPVSYIDGSAAMPDSGTPNIKTLPTTLTCKRTAVTGSTSLYQYDCGLPAVTALVSASALDSSAAPAYAMAGGTDIAAFSSSGATIPTALKVDSTTDLTKLDPSAAITIKFDTSSSSAPYAVILMQGALYDKSQGVNILCLTLKAAGSHTVPAGALAFMPTATSTNPLIITTNVVGFSAKTGAPTWGTYLAGVGKGVFGITCRTPSGLCP
jgi:hypothetical protein